MDYIVRATAANRQIRAFAITSREMVETAREHHNTSPVATAALGRLLSAGAMMGVMMKGEKDMLTIMMKGDGPINGVTVTADSHGNVKGYVGNPNVIIPANYAGKLDVGAAIGYGTLTVIKDMGLKEPYSSQVPLGTSEVAEDLTYYFAASEQVPSAVGLGVLMSKDNTVKQAGGFIVQLMPFAEEEVIDKLEKRINSISSVTEMLEKGMTPEDILTEVMEKCIAAPRDHVNKYAPKIVQIQIDPQKIGDVVGQRGKTINAIIERTGVQIDITDEGAVSICGVDQHGMDEAKKMIKTIATDFEAGQIFEGTVVSIKEFGAFVEFAPGKEGMVHISKISDHRINRVEDVLTLGDKVKVICMGKDKMGRMSFSIKDVPEEA